ncbi:MAG: polysaccharide biosynthesis tyrosine autokinase [Cyanobacteria bacterium P01_E01_bin.6]
MPTQINEPPSQPGVYPPAQFAHAPAAPWLQKDDDDLDLTQLIRIVRRRGWIIAGIAITVASVFWGWTLTRTPIYRGGFRVLIESVDDSNPSQELLLDERGGFGSTVDYDTQIEVLLSAALLQPIVQELQDTYPNLTVDELTTGLSINRLRETKVLQISYQGPETQEIQDILEEAAQHYLEYSFEQRQASLNQGIQFVDDQLPELRDRVNNLQVQVERFRQQYSLLDPENRGDDLSGLISQVEDERQQLQTELSQARSLFQNLQAQLNVSPEEALAAATLSESPRYQALLNQVQELEAQLAVDAAKYQENSPQLQALRDRRDNLLPILETEAADILEGRFAVGPSATVDGNLTPTSIDLGRQLIDAANSVQMLQARSQTLAQVEQSLKQEFALVPGLARQYTDMQRELSIATESLNRFLTTRETLQIDAAQKSIPWQLIAEPRTSPIPISPNIPRNLILGILSGLALGGAAALLVEKLDQVYHSPEELKIATQLPLLGIIPFHPTLEEQPDTIQTAKSLNGARDTVMPSTSAGDGKTSRTTFQASMFYESFRSLYTNIRFLGTDTPIQSLVVSSAVPSEGKSTLALYLARAAAIMGQRVLLIDADLRSPKHHARLGLPNIRGLSNLVSESFHLRDVVQQSPLDENMAVITSGPIPPDPVKLLSSRRMQSLMKQFHEHYDLVIYDMPPIIGFSDSSLVAANTDGMVMVAGLGKTERSAISRALDDVKLSPVTILGVVANGIKSHTTRVYGYYSYYRYYQHKGQEEKAESRAIASSSMATEERLATDYPAAVPPASSNSGWQYEQPHPPSGIPSSQEHPSQSGRNGSSTNSSWGSSAAQGKSRGNTAGSSSMSWFGRASKSSSQAKVATVAPSHPLASLSVLQKSLLGVGAAVVLGAFGWVLYIRTAPQSSTPPDLSSDSTTPTLSDDPSTAVDSMPLNEDAQADSEGADAAVSDSELVPDSIPTPPIEEANEAPILENEGVTTPFPNEDSSDIQPSPTRTPELSPEVQDPFAEAVRLAQEAVASGEVANTPEEWSQIAERWQRASALMAIVAQSDERFPVARDRTVLYRNNGEFARQKVLELLSTKDLSTEN